MSEQEGMYPNLQVGKGGFNENLGVPKPVEGMILVDNGHVELGVPVDGGKIQITTYNITDAVSMGAVEIHGPEGLITIEDIVVPGKNEIKEYPSEGVSRIVITTGSDSTEQVITFNVFEPEYVEFDHPVFMPNPED